ncbi:unnamed protein product [Boreogadus saida]
MIYSGGHVVPQHLLPTASHGDVRQASVGERFQLHIHAQASETKILDGQISGPQNMAKEVVLQGHSEPDTSSQ